VPYPIKVCVVCGEEFELKPGKPGFANRCPECSEPEAEERYQGITVRRLTRAEHSSSPGDAQPTLSQRQLTLLGLPDQPSDPYQNHCTHERDENRVENPAARPDAQDPEEPAANDATDQAENNVDSTP